MIVGPRAAPAASARDLVLDQQRAARRAIDEAALGEPGRPLREGDLEEVERDAPIGVEIVGDQRFQPLRRDALDDACRRSARRDRRRARRPAPGWSRPAAARSRRTPFARRRRRGGSRRAAPRPRRATRRASVIRRVEFADGVGGAAALGGVVSLERGRVRRGVGSKAPSGAMRGRIRLAPPLAATSARANAARGALRRHVDRRAGERERAARAGKAGDQRAVEQRARERRQERRAGGNGEDVWGGHTALRVVAGAFCRPVASARQGGMAGTNA